jgi:ArsR family metal-binding transcriptional regulator
MLLTGYSLEICKSKCQADAKGVHCFVQLDDDVSAVLPYLNTVLGGFVYTTEPPALTLKNYGKLITIHPRRIAINALRDREEAEKIAAWLQREINGTWQNRAEIEPSTSSARQPVLLEILKLLPRTNCRQCGDATCLVFAAKAVEGVRNQDDCPPLLAANRTLLAEYLSSFRFD